MTFLDRIGASLVAPRRAFAEVEAGRGGVLDGALLLALTFACVELPSLVQAGWTALVVGFGAGLTMLVGRVTGFVGNALVVWAAGGIAITLAAGRRRAPAKDMDLAAVAFVPYLMARLVFAYLPAPRAVADVISIGLAIVWWVLAVLDARSRRP